MSSRFLLGSGGQGWRLHNVTSVALDRKKTSPFNIKVYFILDMIGNLS